MKKPEKKERLSRWQVEENQYAENSKEIIKDKKNASYNQACSDWEKWFKSKMKDIPSKYAKLINKHFWELI